MAISANMAGAKLFFSEVVEENIHAQLKMRQLK